MAGIDPVRAPRRGRLDLFVMGAWGLVFAALTLTPRPAGGAAMPVLCLPCGDAGSADVVLNLLLFMPLGVVLTRRGMGWLAVGAVALALSIGVEVVQLFLPGRFPTALDVVANTVGALLGAVLPRVGGGSPRRVYGVTLGLVATALLATAILAVPAPPDGDLYGQWSPRLGGIPPYSGHLEEARVDSMSIGSGRVVEPDRVRRALQTEVGLTVQFRVGDEVSATAPVFAIHSGEQEEAVWVGVRGTDVIVRTRSLAGAWRFREPGIRIGHGLAGLAPGTRVVVTDRGGTVCLRSPAGLRCARGVTPAGGWRMLVGDRWATDTWRRLVSLGWLAVFFLAVWLTAPGWRVGLLGLLGLLGLVVGLPGVTGLSPVPPGSLLAAAASAILVGTVVRGGRKRRGPPPLR